MPLYLRGLLLRGWRETEEGEEKVKGKGGERWREGFGPPKNFGVAPPMSLTTLSWAGANEYNRYTGYCRVKAYRPSVAIGYEAWYRPMSAGCVHNTADPNSTCSLAA